MIAVWNYGDYHTKRERCELIQNITLFDYQELRQNITMASRQAIFRVREQSSYGLVRIRREIEELDGFELSARFVWQLG